MQISDIVSTVSAKAGIDGAAAEHAVGTILSVLQHEVDGTSVQQLLAKIPGAADLAQRFDVMAPEAAVAGAAPSGGGLFGMLSGVVGSVMGAKAQPVLNGIARLKATGLGLTQIEQIGATVMAEARGIGGHDLVNSVLAAAPALAPYIGGATAGTPATTVPAA